MKLKSPIPLSDAVRPAPEPPPLYVYEFPESALYPALHASSKGIGNVAPAPVSDTPADAG
ncbi:unannotated protein [freshwater metagenome]|uniref:Unannotated protein n=1 Tax=freshwater metagenome TaxID=449393 RepID=A0A6J7XVC9_9ZZZZ